MCDTRRHREGGQAAVESALVLPLVTFLILGTLQLFMLLQAKVMAQYAVFQAGRVGSITHAKCDAMLHAAILSLIPTFQNYLGSQSAVAGTPGQRLGLAFKQWETNDYGGNGGGPYRAGWTGDSIIWLARDHPNFIAGGDSPIAAQKSFDVPLVAPATPTHLELKMVFWAPLQIPFADWVFSRMALAQLGILSFTSGNPLMPTQQAAWTAGTPMLTGTEAAIGTELLTRVSAGHYVFPIVVTYSMRMMSPVKLGEFPPFGGTQNCPGTPATLQ